MQTPPAVVAPVYVGPTLKGIEFFDAQGRAHYVTVGIPCPAFGTSSVEQTPSQKITAVISCVGTAITPEIIDEPTPEPSLAPKKAAK